LEIAPAGCGLDHEYGAIKQDLIWEVVAVHLPDLVSRLELMVPQQRHGDDE